MAEASLELAAVLAEAERRTGLHDFGDPAFRDPLERLLRSLREEARLNAVGRAMQFERNVGLLVNRLRTEDHYRRHPEIAQERIERPLVIVGLARTGTTMLHRMMASDPRWLALLWYESRNPAPFPGGEDAAVDPRITDAEAEVAAMLEGSPDLIAVHPMDAHAPDEEIMLVEHAFTSWNPEAFCRVPSYRAVLEAIGSRRRAIATSCGSCSFLQWQKRRRGETAARWVFKAPYHLGSLDALFAVLPDARVVDDAPRSGPDRALVREHDPRALRARQRLGRSPRDRRALGPEVGACARARNRRARLARGPLPRHPLRGSRR